MEKERDSCYLVIVGLPFFVLRSVCVYVYAVVNVNPSLSAVTLPSFSLLIVFSAKRSTSVVLTFGVSGASSGKAIPALELF